jgi:hypothetical protein
MLSLPRYLAVLAIVAAATVGLAWVWAAQMKLAYLDPEYPSWLAKRQLLERCDLGEVLVVGDSRAAVDIVPALLGVPATNLAVGGGEAVEAYSAVRRALACPTPPRRVVISLDAGHFVLPDLFWERTVRFGFLDRAELDEVLRTAERLGDATIIAPRHPDGLPWRVRALLYSIDFPTVQFASLLKGGLLLRWVENRAALRAGIAARGQYFFGTAAGSDAVAAEGNLRAFVPLPVQDHYFRRMLALLAVRGIAVDFVAMPLNRTTARQVRPAVARDFTAYLADFTTLYQNFSVVGTVLPDWPDRYFGDEFAHLNPDGAALFSRRFAACLHARLAGSDVGCAGGWQVDELARALPQPK